MTGLKEACQTFTAEAKASPFSAWLIVENDEIKRAAHFHIASPTLADRITTPKSLALTILKEQRSGLRIIPPEEQYLLFSRFAGEVFESATKTLTENLIDLYITLTLNKTACPTDTQKGERAAAVFSRYRDWCTAHHAADSITAMEYAVSYASLMKPTSCILYRLHRLTPLAATLLSAFARDPLALSSPVLSSKIPDTLSELAVYPTQREEITQTCEKICRLEESGVRGEDILVITPALQTTLPLFEEIAGGFFVNRRDRLTFSVSEQKSIQNFPLIRAVLAWVSAANRASAEDLMLILDTAVFRFPRLGVTSGKLRQAVKMVSSPKQNTDWRDLQTRLAVSGRSDFQKADDERLQRVINDILDTASRRQARAVTLAERVSALRGDLTDLGWITAPLGETEAAARNAFLRLLDRLESAGTADFKTPLADFLVILSRGTKKNAGIPYPTNETAFRIGKIREAAGITVPYVFFIGLTAKNIPNISATLPLLTVAETKALLPDRYREAAEDTAYYFDAAMRSAGVALSLSYAESDGSTACSPSPYLTKFAEGKPANLLDIDHSVFGHQKKAGRLVSASANAAEELTGIRDINDTASRIGVETLSRHEAGEYTAVFSDTPLAESFREKYAKQQTVSPTFLEEYAECPFAWYLTHHLRLENPTNFSVEAIRLGNVMHTVLERYFQNHTAIHESEREEAFAELCSLTREEMEKTGIRTPAWKAKFIGYRGGDLVTSSLRELVDAEIRFAQEGYQASPKWLERTVTAEFSGITVSGRVDRVLRKESGEFMVLDYKTGRVKSEKDAKEGKALQLPIYTEAIRQETGDKPSVGQYLQISPARSEVSTPYKEGAEKMISDAEEIIFSILESIRAGLCGTALSCNPDYCPYKYICRRGDREDADE